MTTDRIDPPLAADEVPTLLGFLNFHRDTLRTKTEGLDAEQLATRLAPSTMTLGGMLKHLALVEDYWFTSVLQGRPASEPWDAVDWDADEDWDWNSAAEDTPEQLRDLLDTAIERSDRVMADALTDGGLETLSVKERPVRHGGGRFSLRWILVHLIEEYARHNGHADLIRESIDGVTGE
ncbi:DinB family protein [Nocardioides sp.]|uniref:DinB family protein n=1 Tax=Nocardioides sp. TaxID=35761 RepID=UPI0035618BBC